MSEEILAFDIILDARLSEDSKKTLEELKSADDTDGGAPGDIGDTAKDFIDEDFTPAQINQIESTIGESLGGVGKAELVQIGAIAKNPTALITKVLRSNFAKVLGPIAIAIIAVEVGIEVIKALSVKGGPLNRDWRRFIQAEVAIGLTREQQKEEEFGVSQVILTQIRGFAPNNANWTYNNLYDVNDERIARIGLSDREAGVTMFIP